MARPTLLQHPKFRRLIATLGIPPAHTLGLLEMMWQSAYASGDPILGDATDVELAAGWTGESGVLCQALLSCGGKCRSGFIDDVDGIYEIHDLYDHAPDYVQKRRKRECERRINGDKQAQIADNGGQRRTTAENGTPPTPTPTPTPTPAHEEGAKAPPAAKPPKTSFNISSTNPLNGLDEQVRVVLDTFYDALQLFPINDGIKVTEDNQTAALKTLCNREKRKGIEPVDTLRNVVTIIRFLRDRDTFWFQKGNFRSLAKLIEQTKDKSEYRYNRFLKDSKSNG